MPSPINVEALLRGERRALAKAITLIESRNPAHRDAADSLLESVMPHTGKSFRLGISGVPGVGKSTFIEAFGQRYTEEGHKVAVLAVDPSSPRSGGSILGDKTRMELLSRDDRAFIRPSPAGESLGGVAQRTRETILLCEAAGFDQIWIETVGVGQSEHAVSEMTDCFMVLMQPGAGDELQGIKKGILELADLIVINKADGDNLPLAERSQRHYANALKLLKRDDFWTPEVHAVSATTGAGLDTLAARLADFIALGAAAITDKRLTQDLAWFDQLTRDMAWQVLMSQSDWGDTFHKARTQVANNQLPPVAAARLLLP